MLVDRRKDNYDELMLLSRDSRERRKRVNRWTTALVAGGMAASAAYVASTGKQVEALQEAAQQADQLRQENALLIAERNQMKAERDIVIRHKEWFAAAAPQLEVAEGMSDLVAVLSGRPGEPQPVTPPPETSSQQIVGLSEVVWMVDGSRRFPMAENDYLWIPEAGTWIQLQSIDNKQIEVFTGDRTAGGEQVNLRDGYHQLDLPGPLPGASNYACLSVAFPSTRPGFQTGRYADLEILFLSAPCP